MVTENDTYSKFFKICYVAYYPNGKLLEPSKPYLEANMVADDKIDAIRRLKLEFPGLDVKVVEEPVEFSYAG